MDGVSGVSGAGPLLHRAVMLTSRRRPAGALTTPAQAGAVALEICRVSGLRAGATCPRAVEWFAPGTEPGHTCDWHRGTETVLPPEYAEWAAQRVAALGEAAATSAASSLATQPSPDASSPGAIERAAADDRFRILSPRDGDRYEIPPGVEPRYATVALRAAGAPPAVVRWYVDDQPVAGERWALVSGAHVIRAVTPRGDTAAVRVEVRRTR